MSPLEHCAQALGTDELPDHSLNDYGWSGNFFMWRQYRKTIIGENKSDPRLMKHFAQKE